MAEFDIAKTTQTDMENVVDDYSVDSQTLDAPQDQKETYYDSPNWSEYLGYYKAIPELKKAIDALAYWVAGKGFTTDTRTKVILETINGWGEDSFQSILQNMITVKKINGDSFAEIILDDNGELINLKPMNPLTTRIVTNRKGIIIRYEQLDRSLKKVSKRFASNTIFHISNDRVGNEMHGVSVIEACKWVIDARNEAMADWRRILHRNLAGVRIIEVEEDNPAQLTVLKTQWAEAINKGEVLILPKGTAGVANVPPPTNPENWIRYLENFFYQAVGVPKIILGGSQEFTEASAKIGYLTFEQVYATEQRLLESDIWSQLAKRLKFERPVSLKDNVEGDEEKNTGQVGIQPNETEVNTTRTE